MFLSYQLHLISFCVTSVSLYHNMTPFYCSFISVSTPLRCPRLKGKCLFYMFPSSCSCSKHSVFKLLNVLHPSALCTQHRNKDHYLCL
ncbi:unnamed protein product, partial [Boreogadus saida]